MSRLIADKDFSFFLAPLFLFSLSFFLYLSLFLSLSFFLSFFLSFRSYSCFNLKMLSFFLSLLGKQRQSKNRRNLGGCKKKRDISFLRKRERERKRKKERKKERESILYSLHISSALTAAALFCLELKRQARSRELHFLALRDFMIHFEMKMTGRRREAKTKTKFIL